MPMKILACQMNVPPTATAAARDAHVARMVEAASAKLAKTPADLVVFPELSTIDYGEESFRLLDQLAEPLEGPSFQAFAGLAQRHDAFVAFGMARDSGHQRHITQVVIDPEGRYAGHYDKLHLSQFGASMEKPYFSPGNGLLVFDVAGFRVAPMICYDLRFPELMRTLCLDHGVEVIIHPSAYCKDSSDYSWHPFVTTRAVENQVYVLSLNRAGENFGCSIFCPPWVDEETKETVFSRDETLEVLEVSQAAIDAARRQYPYRQDRIADYGALKVEESL